MSKNKDRNGTVLNMYNLSDCLVLSLKPKDRKKTVKFYMTEENMEYVIKYMKQLLLERYSAKTASELRCNIDELFCAARRAGFKYKKNAVYLIRWMEKNKSEIMGNL